MKKILFVMLLLLVLPLTAYSEGNVYQKHNISFQIPTNWTIVKDNQWNNDTQIVLSDNVSAIRIDIIKTSDQEINKMVADSVARKQSYNRLGSQVDANTSWKLLYSLNPWMVADGVNEYYMRNVISLASQISNSGSGTTIKPDGTADAGIATNYGNGEEPVEWSISWTRPEYNGEIMGVHALFAGNYTQQSIDWRGSSQEYFVAKPLWTVLSTFATGNKPKSLSLVGMV
jgi:hypothetical protein